MKNSILRLCLLCTIVLLPVGVTNAAQSTKEDVGALEQKRNSLREENAQLLRNQIAEEEARNAELKGQPAPTPQAQVPPASGPAAPAEGGPPRTKVGRETDRILEQGKDKVEKLKRLF
jgi:hypothetical protein